VRARDEAGEREQAERGHVGLYNGAMLDNPIWHALTTEQTRFAETTGDAARFPPEVTALAGLRTPAAAGALVELIRPGESAGIFVEAPWTPPPGLAIVDGAAIVQMIHEGPVPAAAERFDVLGPADAPAMLALAQLTRPGPFGTRTAELGTFLGVRADGKLIAMAGQRMRLPGLVEVSGVCTDPAHLGQGLAARLIRAQLARIGPAFLHVRADNARAIGLYEHLGFRIRRTFDYVIVRAQPRPA